MKIFDSLTRRKVELVPLVPGKVGIYLCGCTVQGSPHIGHARSAIAFDMVRRHLAWTGLDVTFVRNVTDIDDKIILKANAEGVPAEEIARRYDAEYQREMAAVGCLPPTIIPYVTRSIPQILAYIGRLVDAGKAYPADGDVYYAVETMPDYGVLSGRSTDELRAGELETGAGKRSPLDFALWKGAKPGEPSWPSPWGPGRPGWHIECSAMIEEHLGKVIDIHGGGRDLLFPHHENERAQGTIARIWMHNGLLNLGDVKMSKSLGNVYSVEELRKRFDGESIRLALVQHHYRSPIAFEMLLLEEAERRLDYFYGTLARLPAASEKGADEGLVAKVREAMDDDFNSAVALAELGDAARVANKLLDEKKKDRLPRLAWELREAGRSLGLLAQEPKAFLHARRARVCAHRGIDPAGIEARLRERDEARRTKDFARADAIRGELRDLRIEVMDATTGADWRIAD